MIELRKATLDDVRILEYWDTKPHVIAASGDDDRTDWPAALAMSSPYQEYLIAEENDRPVGVMQIIDPHNEETHYWGEIEQNLRAIDIWIGEGDDLGRGYGTQMMALAIERCFDDPAVTAIVIDPLASNTRAHRFYERLGFRFVGARRFGSDDCFVYRLERGYVSS